MKSFISKKALTLVELVISITISSVVMLIVLTFVADSIETVISSNKKTEIYEDLFRFKNDFNQFSRWGYFNQDLIVSNVSWSGSDIILMKNIDSSKGVIFWVVSKESMSIEPDLGYKIYSDKVLWYRILSENEIIDIETTLTNIYNLKFFPDKVYDGLKVKDFQMDMYNSWAIIDMNMEVLLYYNDSNKWILLKDINPEDLININLNF